MEVYTVRMDSSLKILEFKEMSEEWLDFIISCRNGVPIADYIDGIITREQFWSLAKFKYPTHQINFCSVKGLKCLQFISAEEVVR